MRKYETYTFSAAKFFADRGAEGVAQPLTERVNVSNKTDDQSVILTENSKSRILDRLCPIIFPKVSANTTMG
jgi:hypothetical protein